MWPRADAGTAPDLDDERWILVDGRRWRATDPAIPGPLRKEMVDELMSARRAVGVAKRKDDAPAERRARARVHDAKVALGERGAPWWETPSPEDQGARITATVLTLARHRAPGATICPSDVARAIGGTSWRRLMEPVREVVRTLADQDEVAVEQRGRPVPKGRPWKGPIRIRLREDAGAT